MLLGLAWESKVETPGFPGAGPGLQDPEQEGLCCPGREPGGHLASDSGTCQHHTCTHAHTALWDLGICAPSGQEAGRSWPRTPKQKLLALPPPRQVTAASTAGGATSTRVSEPLPPLRLNHVPAGVAETHLLSPSPLLCTLCLPCPADAGYAQSPPPLLPRQIQREAPPTSLSQHPAGPLYPYLTRWRLELTRSREVLLTVFDSQMRKPRPPG